MYDDTTNLYWNTDVYVTQISLYTLDDAILWKAFPASLKGVALRWLPSPNSIDCFDTLVTKFGT